MSFNWSYSKLQHYRTCPLQTYHLDIIKDIIPEKSVHLDTGEALHHAFQRRVEQGTPMPTYFSNLEDWGNDLVQVLHPDQVVKCEHELAVDRDWQPCHWLSKRVYYRCKIDHLKLLPKGRAIAIDFKTGKPKDDFEQLALYSRSIFAHYPKIVIVRAEYWWTMTRDKEHLLFTRPETDERWKSISEDVNKLEKSFLLDEWPAKKNGLCREHCPVVSCEFNGRPK
jgi:hypothetical protein